MVSSGFGLYSLGFFRMGGLGSNPVWPYTPEETMSFWAVRTNGWLGEYTPLKVLGFERRVRLPRKL
jgi:hypothetical protein